jgi:hypothetical protein
MSDILTEFDEQQATDEGVARTVVATEAYSFRGEPVERTTELALLEDGGVHITQRIHDQTVDSLTLSGAVVRRLRDETTAAGYPDGEDAVTLPDDEEAFLNVDADGADGRGRGVAAVLQSIAETLSEAPEGARYDFDVTVTEVKHGGE